MLDYVFRILEGEEFDGETVTIEGVGTIVTAENVADYLCAMDVFAFPSLYEGMPLSVIEVQCNGLPCVISDSVPDDVFLTDLVRPLSVNESKEKWADEICGAKRENELQYSEMIKKTGFDTSEMLRNIYDIYDSVPERK